MERGRVGDGLAGTRWTMSTSTSTSTSTHRRVVARLAAAHVVLGLVLVLLRLELVLNEGNKVTRVLRAQRGGELRRRRVAVAGWMDGRVVFCCRPPPPSDPGNSNSSNSSAHGPPLLTSSHHSRMPMVRMICHLPPSGIASQSAGTLPTSSSFGHGWPSMVMAKGQVMPCWCTRKPTKPACAAGGTAGSLRGCGVRG